jgi:hypothetical protein
MTAAYVLGDPRTLALSPLRTPEQDAAWWLRSEPDRTATECEGLIRWTARMLRRWTTAHALGWPHDVDPHRAAAICAEAWRAASCTDGSPAGDEGDDRSDEAVGSVTGVGR